MTWGWGVVAGAAVGSFAAAARADEPYGFDGVTVGVHGGYGHLHRGHETTIALANTTEAGRVVGLDAGLRFDGGRWLHFAVTAAVELQHLGADGTPRPSAPATRCHIDVDGGTLGLAYSPVPLVFVRGGLA